MAKSLYVRDPRKPDKVFGPYDLAKLRQLVARESGLKPAHEVSVDKVHWMKATQVKPPLFIPSKDTPHTTSPVSQSSISVGMEAQSESHEVNEGVRSASQVASPSTPTTYDLTKRTSTQQLSATDTTSSSSSNEDPNDTPASCRENEEVAGHEPLIEANESENREFVPEQLPDDYADSIEWKSVLWSDPTKASESISTERPTTATTAEATDASISNPTETTGMCPLCGSDYMDNPKSLYGKPVCKKCSHSFANPRTLAFCIDYITYPLVCGFASSLFSINVALAISDSRRGADAVLTICVWLTLGISVLVIMGKDGTWGYSLGKWIAGLRVVRDVDGRPAGIIASCIRNNPLLLVFPFWLIVAIQISRGYRMWDGCARTKVICNTYAKNSIFTSNRFRLPAWWQRGISKSGAIVVHALSVCAATVAIVIEVRSCLVSIPAIVLTGLFLAWKAFKDSQYIGVVFGILPVAIAILLTMLAMHMGPLEAHASFISVVGGYSGCYIVWMVTVLTRR